MITNSAADVDSEAASQIEILFEAQVQLHDGFIEGNTYKISAAITHNGEAEVSLAQDDLTYQRITSAVVKLYLPINTFFVKV